MNDINYILEQKEKAERFVSEGIKIADEVFNEVLEILNE